MKFFIKRHSLELLNLSIVVILSIGLAYGVEWLVVTYSTITTDSAHLLFALTLPIILLSLQYGLRKLMQRPELASGIDIVFPNTLDVNPETLKSVEGLANKLQDYFKRNYDINQLHFCVLDWHRKQFQAYQVAGHTTASYIIPPKHALVQFVKKSKACFITTATDYPVSDLMRAEIMVFMQKHHFGLMVPLVTDLDVYGFIFIRAEDTTGVTMSQPKTLQELAKVGSQFGYLLQQLLIYDAIVLQNSRPKL